MRVLIAGQKHFGAVVFSSVSRLRGVRVSAVCAPHGDRLFTAAAGAGVQVIPSGTLKASTMPDGIDLVVAAHSHDFIGERTRNRARFGGIGYHPSLLPLHRGRDSIRWAIRMRERVTGGTVYRLSNRMDGGNIISQRHVFIRPDDTPEELWRRELSPLGVEMLCATVERFRDEGFINGAEQDESVATWEPSIDRPPAYRPDLLMLPAPTDDTLADVIALETARRDFSRSRYA